MRWGGPRADCWMRFPVHERNKGAKMTISVEGWADAGTAIPKVLEPIFEHYLLGTLAVGVSARSRGFIEELGIVTAAEADDWLKRLEECVAIDPKKKTSEVEEVVALRPVAWEGDTYCTYRRHDHVGVPSGEKAPSGADPIAKSQLKKIDGFYRHLRNALAHGRFRLVGEEGAVRLFYFDLDNQKRLTAVGLVPTASLNELREEACRRIAENTKH